MQGNYKTKYDRMKDTLNAKYQLSKNGVLEVTMNKDQNKLTIIPIFEDNRQTHLENAEYITVKNSKYPRFDLSAKPERSTALNALVTMLDDYSATVDDLLAAEQDLMVYARYNQKEPLTSNAFDTYKRWYNELYGNTPKDWTTFPEDAPVQKPKNRALPHNAEELLTQPTTETEYDSFEK